MILKLILFNSFVLLLQNSNAQVRNVPISKYDRIRELYPKVSQQEASNWRMADKDNYAQHPCKRVCVANVTMTCYYYMVVHYDNTLSANCKRYLQPKYRFKVNNRTYIDPFKIVESEGFNDCKYADGVATQVMVINGQLPGQSIEVCLGDTIIADVINSMHECTTIHWHGVHQLSTPHMDGVPHVTQYPIEAGQAFRYRFEVDHIGTNWWHSHTGHQRAFGLAGALIVRETRQTNVHAALYDYDLSEHVIMIQDWAYNFDENDHQNILINGLGHNLKINKTAHPQMPTLYASFKVMRGGRYRFRVIHNGVGACPIGLSIDNHDLVVIATDGNKVEPLIVQKIVMHSAERFDFVLHANQPVDNYWLRIKGYDHCASNELHQAAILHYEGADLLKLKTETLGYSYEPKGVALNEMTVDNGVGGKGIPLTELKSKDNNTAIEHEKHPYKTYYITMVTEVRDGSLRFQIDDITFEMPRMSFLQTRNLGIGEFFCNKTQQAALGRDCTKRHCQCSNVIQVPAYKNIEFVIASQSILAHPIHLHGYSFRVVGIGLLDPKRITQIEEIDKKQPLPRSVRNAPLKDSVQVPAYGYTIIRFTTNSPGYWLFHCHISSHSESGMATVIRVGEDVQMKMCPVSNCGLCSSGI